MSRIAHRLSLRLSAHAAARSPRVAFSKRMMGSESSAGHGSSSSDTPWMIGSALVFGPLFLYLVSPSARKDHHADHGHTQNHRDNHEDKQTQPAESPRKEDVVPIVDDEGTQVSDQEVKESIEKAIEADSPMDAQEQEEAVAKVTTAEEGSATETRSEAESVTEPTTVPQSEANPTTVTRAENDVATQATAEDTAPVATLPEEAVAESKA